MASLKSQSLNLKRTDLHTLEAGNSSYFWVINNIEPRGSINMTVADGMGNQIPVRVPIAAIPVDLSTQATAKSLLASPQVRTMIAKKVLILVDGDAARTFLETPAAQEEHRRLYALSDIAEVGQEGAGLNELSQAQAEAEGSLNPFAMSMALASDLSEDEVLRELRSREDELSEADFQYIAQNSKYERVKSWAAEKAVG